MHSLRTALRGFLALFRLRRIERDMDREMRAHFENIVDEYRQAGMPEPEARKEARRRFGSLARLKEEGRDVLGAGVFGDTLRDVRFAVRTLRRTPAFTAVVAGSLALGIGANTALFSLVEATLLRDLSVEAPEELVYLRWQSREWSPERVAGSSAAGLDWVRSPSFSNAIFENLRSEAATLTDVFAFGPRREVNASIEGMAERATAQLVSGNFFAGLGAEAVAGRLLSDPDDDASADPAVVISDGFWRRFDRDPALIGSRVLIESGVFTIVGVASEDFRGAEFGGVPAPEFWAPLEFEPMFGSQNGETGYWWLWVMGRLEPQVTFGQVRGNLEGVFRAALEPSDAGDVPELHVLPARRGVRGEGPVDAETAALVFSCVFGALLLIVCLNVANLLLSRSAAREAEIGVRLALGAARGRLVRQLLTESVSLAFLGAAAGLVLAYWGKASFALTGLVPAELDLRFDWSVFVFSVLLAGGVGVLFGLVPALATVGGRSRHLAVRRSPSLLNRGLLVVQVAVSLVLLVGAGLFVRTLGNWSRLDAGFETENLLVFELDAAPLGYDATRAGILMDQISAELDALPGVLAVSRSGPFWDGTRLSRLWVADQEVRTPVRWLPVARDYFDTVRIPLLSGRGLLSGDSAPPRVAIVEQALADRLFGGANPLGRRFALSRGGSELEIVGVAGDTRMPGDQEARPTIYLPEGTRPSDFSSPGREERMAAYGLGYNTGFQVRTAQDPMAMIPAIRDAVALVEADLPLLDPKTVSQGFRERLEPTRLFAFVCLSFGGVALLLTAVGLYGLVAYSVSQRTREIGIRTALGATRYGIVRLVTARTAALLGFGLAAGAAGAAVVGQLARAHIFGVTVYDPPTYASAAALLVLVALAAAFVPARRAVRVDPNLALRQE